MATSTQTLLTAVATDANFRDFCQAVETAFAACGLVRTADTGQTDLNSILKPTATWTVNTKRMWRFNDADQATTPVFLLVQFGVGNPNTMPYFTLTWGTATDGNCNLVGTVCGLFSNLIRSYNSSNSACLWSGNGGRLSMALWNCGGNSYEVIGALERSSAGGCLSWFAGYGMTGFYRQTTWLPYTGGLGSVLSQYSGFYVPGSLATGIVGNTVYTWGYRAYNPVESPGAGSDILLYFNNDLL